MNLLIKAAVLLAAGAAGWALAKRCKDAEKESNDPQVVYLKDDEAVIDAEPVAVPATVKSCFRRMDPLTLNGANEAAVALYLEDKIGFYDIYRLVKGAVDTVPFIQNPTLEQILEADRLAREYVTRQIAN